MWPYRLFLFQSWKFGNNQMFTPVYFRVKKLASLLNDKNYPTTSKNYLWFQVKCNFPETISYVKLAPLSSTQTPSVQHLSSTQGARLFNPKNQSVQHVKCVSSTQIKRQFNTPVSSTQKLFFDAFLVLNWRFFVLNQGSARAVSIEISKIFTYADPWLNVPPLKYF